MNEPSDNHDFTTPDELSAMEALLKQFGPEDLVEHSETDQQDRRPARDRVLFQAGMAAGRRHAHTGLWKVATGVMAVLSASLLVMLVGVWQPPTEQAIGWTVRPQQSSPPVDTRLNQPRVESTIVSSTQRKNTARHLQQITPATPWRVEDDSDSTEEYVAFLKRRATESLKARQSIRKDPS